ncbi:MAG: epoxyqueuosine reductase QueH [Clostridia bacterium]|nr:epoxyqueuosine reductase QueH [Clostridia bacterium]
MEKTNYSMLMEEEIKRIKQNSKKPTLLLHSCCAPCSSSVIELLLEYFDVTVYYYNPNIYPEDEYYKRSKEQESFCREYFKDHNIKVISEEYKKEDFEKIASGLETAKEGGERCTLCYKLRLEKTAVYAKENGYDYFASTLSVSPLKCTKRLNEIGEELSNKYGVKYLYNDFKKKNGYKRSCEISRELGMYRQDWCGCKYSYYERIISSAKGFIFDLDGTLSDTMPFYETYSPNLVRHFGKIPKPTIRDDVRLLTSEEVCEYVVKEYNIPHTPEELLKETYKQLENLYGKDGKLKDGVAEFLDFAIKKGKKICIASATAGKFIEMFLKQTGIYDKFEFYLSCPDLQMYKDKPDIYYLAAEKMGLKPSETIVFEDAHHAVITAKKGGIKVVGVYDLCAEKFTDIIKENADIYVDSMKELIFE